MKHGARMTLLPMLLGSCVCARVCECVCLEVCKYVCMYAFWGRVWVFVQALACARVCV